MSQWQTNSIMEIPKEKRMFAFKAKPELCIPVSVQLERYWESWSAARVLIEGLWEGQHQDKWAALHYALLSSHADMPEAVEGNPLPK